jgi:hypothetical protein
MNQLNMIAPKVRNSDKLGGLFKRNLGKNVFGANLGF